MAVLTSTYTTADIRNLALVGHAGAGKTTLVETLLARAADPTNAGPTERGQTICDFTDEEREHGHSLYSHLVHADVRGKRINLIDTPGSPDFTGQAVSVFPAVETVAVVVNAQNGIESVTRRMMQRAERRKLCRMIIVNKIDAENTDLTALLESLKQAFGSTILPINLPADNGKAVIDCFRQTEGDSDLGPVAGFHTAIVDQVVEVDEDLMELYLEQGEVTPEQLHDPFEKALREGHLVPVCFVAARPHDGADPVGVNELLDLLVDLAPSPLEGNPRPFVRGTDYDHELHFTPDKDKHVIAHVFAVRVDPFVGKLACFRVHQGTVTPDSQLFIDDVKQGESKKPFKVGHLFKVQGKDHAEIDQAIPGDIAAVGKVEDIHYDAVLHDSHDEDNLHLRPIKLPEPMSGLAVSPKKRGDEQKIADAFSKMMEEDPTLKITRDSVTHETVIHGMGELHLRVLLEKLKTRYNVEVDTHPPKIAYRETITKQAQGHHRHKKQTGGAGQFGEVMLRVEPLARGAGFEFSNDTVGGSIPHGLMSAVEKGVRQGLEAGFIAGCPLQDLKVSVYDGKHHPVDSKEIAFVTAARLALMDAVAKAGPVLLEPVVHLEVTAPSTHMGDLTGDLAGKRGRIQGTDMLPGDMALIDAQVPLSEVGSYQSQLKSMTAGQGTFTMELSHFDPVPAHLQDKIAAQHAQDTSSE
ncbi:MAG: elongation factor G [Phycisphaeraceae bacterium]